MSKECFQEIITTFITHRMKGENGRVKPMYAKEIGILKPVTARQDCSHFLVHKRQSIQV